MTANPAVKSVNNPMRQQERSADINSNQIHHRTRSECIGKTRTKSSNADGTQLPTPTFRHYPNQAVPHYTVHEDPEVTPNQQVVKQTKEPGQDHGPDHVPATHKSESRMQMLQGETHEHKNPRKPNEICEHNSKINKPSLTSSYKGAKNKTPPIKPRNLKECPTCHRPLRKNESRKL